MRGQEGRTALHWVCDVDHWEIGAMSNVTARHDVVDLLIQASDVNAIAADD